MQNPSPDIVAASRAVLAHHAHTFRLAGRLLPPAQLDDAALLYAFCRHVDDLADESPSPELATESLDEVVDMLHGRTDANALIGAFLAMCQRRGIDIQAAVELVAGCHGDLSHVRVADDGELLRYSYRVAGTVGLMICGVLEVTDIERARAHAIDLGVGMQLTNISRDVLEDAGRDRVYLPATRLAAAGVEQDVLVTALCQPRDVDITTLSRARVACARTVAGVLTLAERYYHSAQDGFRFIPARARPAIVAAAWMYRAIGRRISARDHAVWLGRTVVDRPTKLAWLARAVARTPLDTLAWRAPRHRADLHVALAGLPGVATVSPDGTAT